MKKLCPTQPLIYKAEKQHLDTKLEFIQEARGRGKKQKGKEGNSRSERKKTAQQAGGGGGREKEEEKVR